MEFHCISPFGQISRFTADMPILPFPLMQRGISAREFQQKRNLNTAKNIVQPIAQFIF
jgi:hypothetical protein